MPNIDRLVEVIETLRSPNGCPWDRAQTLESMRAYLLEETHEVLDAIGLPPSDPHRNEQIAEELGDLLFNVLMMVRIATDQDIANLEDIAGAIADKMIIRHPHVFGDDAQRADGMSLERWESAKVKQKKRRSRLEGIPTALPSLLRAHRQGQKAALVGFDWPSVDGVFEKIGEELQELREAITSGVSSAIAAEYGDVLMAASSLGRHIDVEPEIALQQANNRFRDRFQCMEELAQQQGLDLSTLTEDALDALWEQSKRSLHHDG